MTVPLVKQAHNKLAAYICDGDCVVDATMGNGFDTLFLADRVGPSGKVYAFDLQVAALDETGAKLKAVNLADRVCLINDNHANLASHLIDHQVVLIRCAMFNLGYLPGSDKTCQTNPNSTFKALDAALAQLDTPGIVSVLAYTGHAGGRVEADMVRSWALGLSTAVYRVTIEVPTVVKNSPPELIIIEKL